MAGPIMAPATPSPLAFTLAKPFFPLDLGVQRQAIGAGGPQGLQDGRAGHWQPWPYITAFKRFVGPGSANGYGVPSDKKQASMAPNLFSGRPAFFPIGYRKPQTGSAVSW